MKKTREEKAITLIALIITIVVLLILAVVAINAVTGDGIIQHATNAKTEYEEAQVEEESTLSYYSTYLEAQGDLGPWKQEGDSITNTETKKTIKLGEKVSYNQGSGYTSNGFTTETTDAIGWRVLGINKYGKLELISTNPTTEKIELKGKEDYINAENILNNMCNELYGKGKGADSARSLNRNDIDKLAGVTTGETTEEQKKALDSYYGRVYYFQYIDGTIKRSLNGEDYDVDTGLDKCYFPDETLSAENTKVKIVKETMYDYDIELKLNEKWTEDNKWGNKTVNEFLLQGENNSETQEQYIATKMITWSGGRKRIRFVLPVTDMENGYKAYMHMYEFDTLEPESIDFTNKIRPIVTLKSDAKLVYDEEEKVWNIS